MNQTRENLLGYLLGALEPAEMRELEAQLETNPELRCELAAVEAALAPLGFPERDDDSTYDEPPTDLVSRTLEFVDDAKEQLATSSPAADSPMPASIASAAMGSASASPGCLSSERIPAAGARMRCADVIVTASVMLAGLALLFPAIWSSRQSSQIAACAENLRHVGLALTQDATQSPSLRFVSVPPYGPRAAAGIYGPVLQDKQLLESPRLLVCPSSSLAEQVSGFRVPTLAEIDSASGELLGRLKRSMGGTYGFNVGYFENGRLCSPKYEGRSYYAILADAPAGYPERRSPNHGGRGQNVLFEDGHVQFLVPVSNPLGDHLYLNDNGIIAAGVDGCDQVVVESGVGPIAVPISGGL